MQTLTKKAQSLIIVIIIGIIVVILLGYYFLSLFSDKSYNQCLGQKYCEDVGLNFSSVESDKIIYCESQIKSFSAKRETFLIQNITILKNKYKECNNG